MRELHYQITDEHQDMTVRDFLQKKGFSRQIFISMKPYPEAIMLNGSHPYMDTRLKHGDSLIIHLPLEKSTEKIIPVPLSFSIIFEDEDILVINKPAFMPVHPSQGNYENTLANAVAYHMYEQGEHYPYRCINRLDRDTTGVLVISKNALSSAILYQQMRERKIRRTYLALVEGITPESGTIDAPISRVNDSTIMREINYVTGETAITHYERLEHNGVLSLLELHLETGRTHQIRVHMKHIGHPLPGDFLYNPESTISKRQTLHSYQLEFHHPISGESLCFTAPVPDDIVHAFLNANK